mmetsp:Transcript_21984/g.30528  ORF Transcript_21984/g.30528 Transcript_21984/m.30528 type:complete len:81 (-) Transcript_21984:30-272(-)
MARRPNKKQKKQKRKELDSEAGKQKDSTVLDSIIEFECWRCNCMKKSKSKFTWHTSQGEKIICNGCNGFLISLVRKKNNV